METDILAICMFFLGISVLLSLFRVLRGPFLLDRAIGLEVFTLSTMGILALHAERSGTVYYYDVLFIWALTAFIATSALGIYLYKEEVQ